MLGEAASGRMTVDLGLGEKALKAENLLALAPEELAAKQARPGLRVKVQGLQSDAGKALNGKTVTSLDIPGFVSFNFCLTLSMALTFVGMVLIFPAMLVPSGAIREGDDDPPLARVEPAPRRLRAERADG